ncbi:TIGR00730 family Rossman fold protein [Rhodovibrionaceae bacterium A322]
MKKETQGNLIKAYRDPAFIDSPAARPVRILSEYLDPQNRFQFEEVTDTIIFFGSARTKSRQEAEALLAAARQGDGSLEKAEMALEQSRYYEESRELARRLTKWSLDLEEDPGRYVICTGGGPGIMEAANRGASEAGGKSIGLTISIPEVEEFENPYVPKELAFEFHYFFMRKFWFTYLAKAVVVMPGGFGTLDELFELLTLIQTKKMNKEMPIVLYGKAFWDRVLTLEALVEQGTVSAADLDLFIRTDSLDEAFNHITRGLTAQAPVKGPTL